MAKAGPLFPYSAFPVTVDDCYPTIYQGGNSVEDREEMMGISTTAVDRVWHLCFQMPPEFPAATTGKLVVLSRANAATGGLEIDPQWKSVAPEEDPSANAAEGGADLSAETDTSVDWATGDEDVIKETVITLDADTLVVDEVVHMNLIFSDDATTALAVPSGHIAFIIWE